MYFNINFMYAPEFAAVLEYVQENFFRKELDPIKAFGGVRDNSLRLI